MIIRLLAISQTLLALCIVITVNLLSGLRKRIESLESLEQNRQIKERAERRLRNE